MCLNRHIYTCTKIRKCTTEIFWKCCRMSLINKICEGWNHKFYNMIGRVYFSIWRATSWMQKEQESVSTLLEQDAFGQRHGIVRYIKRDVIKIFSLSSRTEPYMYILFQPSNVFICKLIRTFHCFSIEMHFR